VLERDLALALELVVEAEAGGRLRRQAIDADRPTACLAAAVGALAEALLRLFHFRELVFDLLAKRQVALSDERLGPQVGRMLVDGGQRREVLAFVLLPQPLALELDTELV
jgi:hypothetical protein